MNKIKLVDGKEIDTTNKTLSEVMKEAFRDIPLTIDDCIEIEDTLRKELHKQYGSKCRKFEETLDVKQQDAFYELERIQEMRSLYNYNYED